MSNHPMSAAPTRLWRFHGGLHLPDHKALSNNEPIARAVLPSRLILPLQQHIGAPAKPLVEVGSRVLKGEMIAQADGYVSVPLHAPTSGTVSAIELLPVPHPSGMSALCLVLEPDGKEEWFPHAPVRDYVSLDPSELRSRIRDAGIVGLGGAGFPSFIKLNPGARTAIDTLILNGAECEPYISCDDRLMRERPEEIIAGAHIMRHALHARRVVIGIEDNKPEAFAALDTLLKRLGSHEIEVILVPTRYPTGGEKQLIKVITGKEVPSGGLPLDIGVVCHNVATAAAVHRAIDLGEPLISRIVTISGHGIAHPRNLEVLFGTPVNELLAQCGGTSADVQRLVMGGPLMGIPLQHSELPIIKTANCILAVTAADLGERGPEQPCIRCGECAKVCPATLLPQQLYWYARAKDFDKAQDYNLFDCIECGCCAYVCPSNLPLVHYYRFAKTTIWAQERDRNAADLARERHEFREYRQEREKAERAEKLAKKKAALEASENEVSAEDAKKAAIKAAMERAKAKREASDVAPKNTDNLTEAQQRKISEIETARTAGEQNEPSKES